MKPVEIPAGYTISCDPALLNLDTVHGFLSNSYWARGIAKSLVEKSIRNSLCWGVYFGREQVGVARVVSDKATFAYLCDVLIAPQHRRKGLSKALVAAIKSHPDLQGLRRWMLVTIDAHGLYEQFDFTSVLHPECHMEIHRPGLYASPS